MRHLQLAWLLVLLPLSCTAADSFPVTMQIDASQPKGEVNPFWRFFGADEPNYAYMTNGQKLVAELGDLGRDQVYFRTHNLLNSGDGSPGLKWGSTGVYQVDAQGTPSYDWTILDRIFDTYRQRGVRPYVEIGFMPEALSSHPEPYQHHWTPRARYEEIYTGWAYPPNDYRRWGELVFQWARHCLEHYGQAEVERWFWEVWNEPNIGYWRGTPEEFMKLHDYAIDAVRRTLPTARVGGPDSAGSGGKFTRGFLEHCLRGTNYATGKIGTPLDFVSFHAKGAPVSTNGHVRMGIAAQLRTIEEGFRLVGSYPELKRTPIVIGECDPEGCAACQGPALAYRNGTMYSSYTAASFARAGELAEKLGVNLVGALTWAFEFEDQPYFAGFRSLASNGVDKPVLNVFRMFSRMHGRRLEVTSDHQVPLERILREGVRGEPDVAGLASLDEKTLCILLWQYHDDDVPGPDATVQLKLNHLPVAPGAVDLQEFRIDQEHGNAYTLWQQMGSPQHPTPEQSAQLDRGGKLIPITPPRMLQSEGEQSTVEVALPRQAVVLLEIRW